MKFLVFINESSTFSYQSHWFFFFVSFLLLFVWLGSKAVGSTVAKARFANWLPGFLGWALMFDVLTLSMGYFWFLTITELAFFFHLLLNFAFFSFLILVKFGFSLQTSIRRYEELLFVCFFGFIGMTALLSVADFFLAFLLIEFSSFCFYILSASGVSTLKDDLRPTPTSLSRLTALEAGLKYFILGSIGSAMFIFGVSLIYGTAGTLNFFAVGALANIYFLEANRIASILFFSGLSLVFIGVLFKIGASPFHFWVPDVYEGSPIFATAYFAIVGKTGFIEFFALLYWNFAFESFVPEKNFLIYLGILSVFIGSLGAIAQANLMRFIAFSSISHVGFMLMIIGLGAYPFFILLVGYLFIYLVLIIIFFGLIAIHGIYDIFAFAALSRLYPVYAWLFIFNLFSFAGLPPFAGFFIKLGVFFSLFDQGFFASLAIVLLLSVLAAFYYVRLTIHLYFLISKVPLFSSNKDVSRFFVAFLGILSGINILLIVLLPAVSWVLNGFGIHLVP